MSRYLTILEVSQKQAYIFSSKQVKDNIANSAVIAHALSPEYIAKTLGGQSYSDENNLVYSGGGHTILEFETSDQARAAVSQLTETIFRDFDGLGVFAKTIEYDETLSPKDNLVNLTKALERKKSIRQASFCQGAYGIEKVDVNSLQAIPLEGESEEKKLVREREHKSEETVYTPEGFSVVRAFEELGGTRGESNYIAIVHIDGNGMGKRVEEFYEMIGSTDWTVTKNKLRAFSDGIDSDFKAAYKETAEEVGRNLNGDKLSNVLSLKGNSFPMRRIITAGDDICFVAEGRIGIECARIFLEKLSKRTNVVDHKNYSACAGVAIVHRKYPFYRAYELAEQLCSNAKKMGAMISPEDNGRLISSIDWHIENGEVRDTLEDTRQDYRTQDNLCLEMRPYIVDAPKSIMDQTQLNARLYSNFIVEMRAMSREEGKYGIGKLKELRGALKQGEVATVNYLKFNKMTDIGKTQSEYFQMQTDGKKHSVLFDCIELLDTFLELEGGLN